MQPMIDFHTHIFPDGVAAKTIPVLEKRSGIKADTDGTLSGLRKTMELAGITKSVVLPVVTAPRQEEAVLSFARQINEENDRVISFAGIHPNEPQIKARIREIKEQGFLGIKLHPDYQETPFTDISYKRIVSAAAEEDLIVLVHGGIDIGLPQGHCQTPAMSAEVIDETGIRKLVIAHMGGWKLWDEVEEYLMTRPCYFDTSFVKGFLSEERVVELIREKGADHILFGTDSPWGGLASYVEWFQSLPLTKEEKEQILFGNANELLEGGKRDGRELTQ